jgi:hypothetical protein
VTRWIPAVAALLVASCPPSPGGSDGGVVVAADGGAPRDAGVHDAGAGVARDGGRSDRGPGCGAVTSSGQCEGDVLVYCNTLGEVARTDCGSRGKRCGLQPTYGGSWCIGQAGATCEVPDTDVCEPSLACVDQVCVGGGPVDGGPVDGGPVDGGPVDGGPGPADGAARRDGSPGPWDAGASDATT